MDSEVKGDIGYQFTVTMTLDAPLTAEAVGMVAHVMQRMIDEDFVKAIAFFGKQSPSDDEVKFFKQLYNFWQEHFKDAVVGVDFREVI